MTIHAVRVREMLLQVYSSARRRERTDPLVGLVIIFK